MLSQNKQTEIDQRRYICMKSQIQNLTSKNNALNQQNRQIKKVLLEALSTMNDTESFLKEAELSVHKIVKQLKDSSDGNLNIDEFATMYDVNHLKQSKSINSCKRRLENMIKEERRNYTLSNFSKSAYYSTTQAISHYDDIEECDIMTDIKLDKSKIWSLEQKLSGILKRSLEIYKANIIEKHKFEKMKVLKFSELLRDTINELLTLGVGIRSNDCSAGSKIKRDFESWDTYVEQNLTVKIDPIKLQVSEQNVYLTDEVSNNLW